MADRLVSHCQAATVEASKSWPPEQRSDCVALLEDAVRRIDEAVALWEGALETPDRSEVQFTAIVHVGAERAKALQRLHFDQKALAVELTGKTGIAYRDALGIDDSIAIVQPYDQFRADESIHVRARGAVETLRERARRLVATIASIRRESTANRYETTNGRGETAGDKGGTSGDG